MEISRLNVRVTFQKNTILEDEIGNRVNEWVDDFSCYATVSNKNLPKEDEAARVTRETHNMYFTVRYCSELKDVQPGTHRIILGERIYNIVSVDDMAFRHHSLKYFTELARDTDEDGID